MLLAIVPLHFQDYFPTPITDQNEVDETELRGEEVGEHCFGLLVIYFDLVHVYHASEWHFSRALIGYLGGDSPPSSRRKTKWLLSAYCHKKSYSLGR